MKAVVLNAPRQISVEAIDEPTLSAPTDVLLRLTSTAICGTDLHIYEGRLGDGARLVIGHEPLGIVERVGDGVTNVRVGDRVTVPTHICCGFCSNCVHGFSGACLTNNPGKWGAAYGYPGMGGYTAHKPNCCASRLAMPTAYAYPASRAIAGSTTSCCSPTRCQRHITRPNSPESYQAIPS